MLNWDQNQNWAKMQPPNIGDIAHLKLSDAFPYLFKVLITSVSNDQITGSIDAVFDYKTKAQITGGAILCHVGKSITFRLSDVDDIIKKN